MSVTAEQETILQVVQELTQQISGCETRPQLHSELEVELGLGSLERLELVRRLEERLGRPIDALQVFGARRVAELLPGEKGMGSSPPLGKLGQRQLPPFPRQAETLIETLLYQAQQQPDSVAILILEEDRELARLSYRELLEQVQRVGGGLRARGVELGEPVALMLPTGPDYFLAFFGALWAGAVPVPLYPPVRLDQLQDYLQRQHCILKDCRARFLIAEGHHQEVAQGLGQQLGLEAILRVSDLVLGLPASAPPLQAHSLAFLQYTSGSTGDPKGVALTHRNLLVNLWALGRRFEPGPEDVLVSWLPLYHDMGMIGMALLGICHGLPLVCMRPEQFLARPERWLQAISHYRGTITAAPNFAYALCAQRLDPAALDGLDLSCWKVALNGAEPVLLETVRAFEEKFRPLGFRASSSFPGYGLAEATLAVSTTPLQRGIHYLTLDREELQRNGRVVEGQDPIVSCGTVVDDCEVSIVNAQGEPLEEGREGRILIRGAAVMSAYYGRPAPAQEWLDTGDLGFFLGGELYLTGRARDLIIVAGRNLHPNDLETLVAAIPGVRAGCVACFGVTREGSETLVVAAETREPGSRLRQSIQARVVEAVGVRPEVCLCAPRSLPKTPSGKLRRQESRQRYLAGRLRPARRRKGAISMRALWCWGWALLGWLGLQFLRLPLALVARGLLRALGIQVRIQGQPLARTPVCLVSNHASLLDGLILLASWPGPQSLRFVVAESTARHPLAGPLTRGQVRVRRGSGLAGEALVQIQKALEQGQSLAIFPEGGIEANPGVRSFATGAFRACSATSTPLQPVAILGSRTCLPQGSWVPQPGTVTVHFLEPLLPGPDSFEESVRLARVARQRIAETVQEGTLERRLARQD